MTAMRIAEKLSQPQPSQAAYTSHAKTPDATDCQLEAVDADHYILIHDLILQQLASAQHL